MFNNDWYQTSFIKMLYSSQSKKTTNMHLLTETVQESNVETLENGLVIEVNRSDSTSMPIISVSIAVGHYHENTHCYGFSHLLEHMIFHHSKAVSNEQNISIDSNRDLEKLIGKYHGEIAAIEEEYRLKLSDPVRALFSVKKHIANKAHPFHRFTVGNRDTLENIDRPEMQDQLRNHHDKYYHAGNIAVNIQLPLDGNYEQEIQSIKSSLTQNFVAKPANFQLRLPPLYPKELRHSWVHVAIENSHSHLILCWFVEKSDEMLDNSALSMVRRLIESKHKNGLFDLLTQAKYLRAIAFTNGIEQDSYLEDSDQEDNQKNTQKSEQELQLHLTLTAKGEKERGAVINMVYDYLSFLSNSQLANWRFDELNKQQELLETNNQAHDPIEICISDAQALHSLHNLHSVHSSLDCSQHIDCSKNGSAAPSSHKCVEAEFNALPEQRLTYNQLKQRVKGILDVLKCEAHQVFVVNDTFDERLESKKQYSPFYHTPYAIFDKHEAETLNAEYAYTKSPDAKSPDNQVPDTESSFTKSSSKHQTLKFSLAAQNIYMPSYLLSVRPELPPNSLKIMEQHGVLLKFAQIAQKAQPYGDCFVSINNAAMCDTLQSTMSKKIWVEGFANYCKKRFYQASDAGINFRVYGHQHGVTIHTTGFNDKQIEFLLEVIDCALHFTLNEDEFLQVKTAILKRLSARLFNKAINRLFANLTTFVQGTTYSIKQQIAAVNDLSFDALNTHQQQFFKQNYVEALLAGNWRLFCVQKLHQQLQSRLTANGTWQKPSIQAKAIPEACMPVLFEKEATEAHSANKKDEDCAVVLYQQVRHQQVRQLNVNGSEYSCQQSQALCLILEHILGPHVFNRLRKDLQLAYLVGVGYKPINA